MFLEQDILTSEGFRPLVLVFMRHGNDDHLSGDLLPSGRNSVREHAEILSDRIVPDCLYSSCAKRAQQTAAILSDVFAQKTGKLFIPISTEPTLAYERSSMSGFVKKFLPAVDTKYRTVFALSHHENISKNTYALIGKSIYLACGEAAILTFNAPNWSQISQENLIDQSIGWHVAGGPF